jgi:hypothetical protein
MNWVELDTDKGSCNRAKKCNWISDGCEGSDCKNCFKPSEYFCGYCYDDAHCVQIPQVQSRTECEDLEACLLPDGTMELMSKEECLQQQSCTQPCYDGTSCESGSGLDNVCISTDNQETCSGTWREDLNVCVMPLLGEVLCVSAGYSFYTCNRLDLQECGSCYEGSASCPVSSLLQCHVVPQSSCSSKGDCEQEAGSCDDTEFYSAFGKVRSFPSSLRIFLVLFLLLLSLHLPLLNYPFNLSEGG